MIISQSPVGGTMVPLIFGPRTVPPAGTLTIARKPADWAGSRGASTVARYSVSTDTVGVCIIHSSLLNLHWFDSPHEANDRIDIGRRHLGIPVVRHWSCQLRTVWSNGLGDCILDLFVAPLAEPLVRIRSDIATDARRDSGESR